MYKLIVSNYWLMCQVSGHVGIFLFFFKLLSFSLFPPFSLFYLFLLPLIPSLYHYFFSLTIEDIVSQLFLSTWHSQSSDLFKKLCDLTFIDDLKRLNLAKVAQLQYEILTPCKEFNLTDIDVVNERPRFIKETWYKLQSKVWVFWIGASILLRRDGGFIKILSALRIEACWSLCVVFSSSLFSSLRILLFLVIWLTVQFIQPLLNIKFPLFHLPYSPKSKPFLLFKTLNPTYFYQIAIKWVIKSLFNLNTTPKLSFQQYVTIDLQILLTPQQPHIDKFFYVNKFCYWDVCNESMTKLKQCKKKKKLNQGLNW